MSEVDRNLINVVIPFGVFVVSIALSMWLLRRGLGGLSKWAKDQDWPADEIIYKSITQPLFVFCLALSSYLALFISSISAEWKVRMNDSFGTLCIFLVVLAALEIIQKSTSLYGQRVNLRGVAPAVRNVLSAGLVAIAILLVLGLWGAPTTPILFVIGVILIGIILILREAGPDYIAAFQIAFTEHVVINENVKLPDGQRGIVTKLGWHNVELHSQSGDIIIIPNSKFIKLVLTKPISNLETYNAPKVETPVQPIAIENLETEKPRNLEAILSKRELQIARLVSQGITNRELAEKLFISENTVKVHIQNILQKLELKNRQQIAYLVASYQKSKTN